MVAPHPNKSAKDVSAAVLNTSHVFQTVQTQFVYNYILNNFVFINFFDFLFIPGAISFRPAGCSHDRYGQGYIQLPQADAII